MSLRVQICGTAQPTLKSQDVCPPLSKRLTTLGFEIEDDIQKTNLLISFNHNQDVYDSFREIGGGKEAAVLIRLEPAAVFPAQYRQRVEDLYGQIITPGSSLTTPTIPWPYYFNQNPLRPDLRTPALDEVVSQSTSQGLFDLDQWSCRPIKLSLIASNKVSSISENNYQLRRKLAHSLPKGLLTIYGDLWNSNLSQRFRHRIGILKFAFHSGVIPNLNQIYGNLFREYPSAIGVVGDKHEIIRKSKFSLVIENDNNYVSEKLIDALIGGSLPIYFGGDYEAVGIPSGLAFTGLNSENDIMNLLHNTSEEEILVFQHKLKEWLHSPSFYEHWAGDHVFVSIADEIAQYFRKVAP